MDGQELGTQCFSNAYNSSAQAVVGLFGDRHGLCVHACCVYILLPAHGGWFSSMNFVVMNRGQLENMPKK